jgi:hypothetical protein
MATEISEPNDYVSDISLKITVVGEDKPAGTLRLQRVLFGLNSNRENFQPFDILDAHTAELTHTA